MIAVRSIDFKSTGIYNVFTDTGIHVADIFRDEGNWYETDKDGAPQTHYTMRWRGFTKKEALESLQRRYT